MSKTTAPAASEGRRAGYKSAAFNHTLTSFLGI